MAADGAGLTAIGHGSEQGQSLLEFLLTFPLLLGLTVITVRVNTAIQSSIVNQKYARAQTLFLTFNSPHYPERDVSGGKTGIRDFLAAKGVNQMVVGVSETAPPDGGAFKPDAPSFKVNRTQATASADADPGSDPDETSKVLIRNTVTLCTETLAIQGENGVVPFSLLNENFSGKSIAQNFCKGHSQ